MFIAGRVSQVLSPAQMRLAEYACGILHDLSGLKRGGGTHFSINISPPDIQFISDLPKHYRITANFFKIVYVSPLDFTEI